MSLRLFPLVAGLRVPTQPLRAVRQLSTRVSAPARPSVVAQRPSSTTLGGTQFFSSFRPSVKPPVSSSAPATSSSLGSNGAHKVPPVSGPWSFSPSSLTPSFIRRFSTSRPVAIIRETYFRPPPGGRRRMPPPPPKPSFWKRLYRRVDDLNPMTVVYALIGTNIAVFLLWQYAIQSAQRFRDPKLFMAMWANFILSEVNIRAGRIWTLVTSSFSHMGGSHIFVNCLGLYFVAPAAAALIGPARFIGLYLGGGLFSGLCSLAYQHKNRGNSTRPSGSEGASGAIYTCLAFYGTVFPRNTFLLFFVIPMPAWALVGGIFAWDMWSAISGRETRTDSAGHMGGIIAGVTAGLLFRRKYTIPRF